MPLVKKLDLYSYDANPDGTAKIPMLMKHFQQIAREDLRNFGITYNMMRDYDQVFVIIKLKIEFKKKITIYDELYLKTVPTKIVGITFYRDFFITDVSGEICAVASSAWVLMNYKTRRIIKPADIVAPVPHFPDDASDVVLTRRFPVIDSPILQKTNVRKVYFSNLDENNHFNNTETAAFAIDEICDRIVAGDEISSIEIHFNHESRLGDELNIITVDSPAASIISAENNNFDANAFECYITYNK